MPTGVDTGGQLLPNLLRSILSKINIHNINYCHKVHIDNMNFTITRYSYSLKKQIQVAKKIYFIDQAMATTVGFRFSEDQGRLLETIVFLQLKRQAKELYFHKEKKECDFVIRDGYQIIEAIQVTVENFLIEKLPLLI